MDKTFTASEVRDIAWSLDGLSRQMLRAFADLLEAREKAVPVGMLRIGADASNQYGKIATFHYADACMDLSLGDHEVFPHPAPSDAERLAEALREQAAKWVGSMYFGMGDENEQAVLKACANDVNKILAAHYAQAQPPAAGVTDAIVRRMVAEYDAVLCGDPTATRTEGMRAALEAALVAQENPNG